MKGARLVSEKESRKIAKDIKRKINKFSDNVLGGECKTPGLKIKSKGRGNA